MEIKAYLYLLLLATHGMKSNADQAIKMLDFQRDSTNFHPRNVFDSKKLLLLQQFDFE